MIAHQHVGLRRGRLAGGGQQILRHVHRRVAHRHAGGIHPLTISAPGREDIRALLLERRTAQQVSTGLGITVATRFPGVAGQHIAAHHCSRFTVCRRFGPSQRRRLFQCRRPLRARGLQTLHDGRMPARFSQRQRSATFEIHACNIGAAVQQQLDHRQMTALRCHHQRRAQQFRRGDVQQGAT
ncbi:hypothetical protein G6F40_015579 [Rhizopus arrhizus]|nr:hypothetical protein G6F23_013493 [Rhizopus arrhizus]KAG1081231.1 hypothetical protein G6F40_015579 [Rhizopus arrhizus]